MTVSTENEIMFYQKMQHQQHHECPTACQRRLSIYLFTQYSTLLSSYPDIHQLHIYYVPYLIHFL